MLRILRLAVIAGTRRAIAERLGGSSVRPPIMFKRLELRRACFLNQKACEFGFCNLSSSRDVRFVQNEEPVLTEPPAIAAFALVDLATLAQLYQRAESSGGVQ